MNDKSKKESKNFRNLKVYQNSFNAFIEIMKNIKPKLPDLEKYDLKIQMSRSCKAIPRLIAEGYA